MSRVHPRFVGVYEPDVEARRRSHLSRREVWAYLLASPVIIWLMQYPVFMLLLELAFICFFAWTIFLIVPWLKHTWRERRVWPHRFSWWAFLRGHYLLIVSVAAVVGGVLNLCGVI